MNPAWSKEGISSVVVCDGLAFGGWVAHSLYSNTTEGRSAFSDVVRTKAGWKGRLRR